MKHQKSSSKIVLNIVFSAFFIAEGVFILIYKKLFIFGKYSGATYELDYTPSILIALSSFSIAAIGIVTLFNTPCKIKIGQTLFGVAFLLFTVGFFL